MSISNRKPGEKRESHGEPLKRSIAGCLRAVARLRRVVLRAARLLPAAERDRILAQLRSP